MVKMRRERISGRVCLSGGLGGYHDYSAWCFNVLVKKKK